MGTKISGMTSAGTLDGTELVEVTKSGATKRTTTQAIADLGGGGSSVGLLARAHNTTGKLLANSTTSIINFDTSDYDPGTDITTGASWHYTAPATAWYDIRFVSAFVNSDGSAWVVGSGVRFDVYKNGSAVGSISFADAQATTSSIDLWVGGTFAVSLTAADTLDLRFVNSSGAQRELESDCAIEIYRVT